MNVALTVVSGGLDKAAAGPVLCVKNWERFQHYQARHPPWIRLYNSLLDDYEFTRLPDASKWLAVGLWLLASRNDNIIPDDAQWIAQHISARSPVDLEALVTSGFLVRYANASAALAAREQVARPEESREEREIEKKKKSGARVPRRQPKPPRKPSWTARAGDSWMEHLGGTPSIGRLGAALKPLVKNYGEVEVLENWDAYLTALVKQGRGTFATPEDFASRYGYYKQHGTRQPDHRGRTQESADERVLHNRQAIEGISLNASKGPFDD